jgi:hypothetical protein
LIGSKSFKYGILIIGKARQFTTKPGIEEPKGELPFKYGILINGKARQFTTKPGIEEPNGELPFKYVVVFVFQSQSDRKSQKASR